MRHPPLLLLCLACLACLLAYEVQDLSRHVCGQVAQGDLNGTDFPTYYAAAQRVRAGLPLYDVDLARQLGGYTYPPLSVLLFLPFTRLREPIAYLLFQLANVLALALSCVLILRARRRIWSRESRAQAAGFVLLVVTSGPSFSSFVLGQVSAVVAALCLAAVLLAQHRRHALAGLALALACWIKIYPALLAVAFLASRPHRMTGVMTLAFGVLLPACFLWIVPFHLYPQYFLEVLPALTGSVMVGVYNQSLLATLVRWGLPLRLWFSETALGVEPWMRVFNRLVLLGAMALFAARRVRRSRDLPLVALLALALFPLVGPLSWGHSFLFSMFLVSYCVIFAESAAGRALAFLAWLMLLFPAYSSPGILRSMPVLVQKAAYARYPAAVVLVLGIALRQLLLSREDVAAAMSRGAPPAGTGPGREPASGGPQPPNARP